MTPRLLYRIASVLLVLFAAGHQAGFQKVAPEWHADAVVAAMKSVRFQVQGMNRSYWDFFSGFGYFVTILLLFCAVLAWQLGGLPQAALASLTLVRWAFAAALVVVAFFTWRHFFMAPLIFSAVVAALLVAAALTSQKV